MPEDAPAQAASPPGQEDNLRTQPAFEQSEPQSSYAPAYSPEQYEPDVGRQPPLLNAETSKEEPHTYLYVGSVLLVLGFYFLYIFLCKWRKDNKNKKPPVKNELVEEKTDDPGSSKMAKEVELVELP